MEDTAEASEAKPEDTAEASETKLPVLVGNVQEDFASFRTEVAGVCFCLLLLLVIINRQWGGGRRLR